MSSAPVLPGVRSKSLAFAFQDAITVILRVRYRTQRVADAAAFRDSVRKMIAAAVQEARQMGYSDQTSKMALYAIVGFLDESVLTSQDPTFQDWARRPLQEEMFGNALAGEYFFQNVNGLLNQPESSEVADALELHAVCLLLGYRGRFAFGDSGEVQSILHRIREKITRIRGQMALSRVSQAPNVAVPRSGDPWIKWLILTTAAMVVIVIIAYAGYSLLLSTGLNDVRSLLELPALTPHGTAVAALFAGGTSR